MNGSWFQSDIPIPVESRSFLTRRHGANLVVCFSSSQQVLLATIYIALLIVTGSYIPSGLPCPQTHPQKLNAILTYSSDPALPT